MQVNSFGGDSQLPLGPMDNIGFNLLNPSDLNIGLLLLTGSGPVDEFTLSLWSSNTGQGMANSLLGTGGVTEGNSGEGENSYLAGPPEDPPRPPVDPHKTIRDIRRMVPVSPNQGGSAPYGTPKPFNLHGLTQMLSDNVTAVIEGGLPTDTPGVGAPLTIGTVADAADEVIRKGAGNCAELAAVGVVQVLATAPPGTKAGIGYIDPPDGGESHAVVIVEDPEGNRTIIDPWNGRGGSPNDREIKELGEITRTSPMWEDKDLRNHRRGGSP